jgi:hypothetical protein
MTNSEPPIMQPPFLPRPSRWPYWVFVPICALAYTVFCFGFMLEAWGRLGESKPWWFEVAFVLAIPGLWLPPLHRLAVVWWSYRLRPHPTGPADSRSPLSVCSGPRQQNHMRPRHPRSQR